MAQTVKNPPAVRETWVQFLGPEDSPGEENGNPVQYSCLQNPMNRGGWWAAVRGVTRVGYDRVTNANPVNNPKCSLTVCCGYGRSNPRTWSLSGNGKPLQYSYLENAMDRGSWWATVHVVTKNQT